MIRAKYTGGVLKPLDELNLNEGEIVSIIIEKKLPTGIADLVNEMRKNTPKTENPVKVLGELRR
ncbi:MAG: antitoxin family protein [Desulfurococcales archaeon]|nr:antitoxin family protein [Desulfurococcales archaeon]